MKAACGVFGSSLCVAKKSRCCPLPGKQLWEFSVCLMPRWSACLVYGFFVSVFFLCVRVCFCPCLCLSPFILSLSSPSLPHSPPPFLPHSLSLPSLFTLSPSLLPSLPHSHAPSLTLILPPSLSSFLPVPLPSLPSLTNSLRFHTKAAFTLAYKLTCSWADAEYTIRTRFETFPATLCPISSCLGLA